MSQAPPPAGEQPDRPSGRPTPTGRRVGRFGIPALVIGVFVFIFAFILLVSQCGTDDEGEVYDTGSGVVPVTVLSEGGAAPGR